MGQRCLVCMLVSGGARTHSPLTRASSPRALHISANGHSAGSGRLAMLTCKLSSVDNTAMLQRS